MLVLSLRLALLAIVAFPAPAAHGRTIEAPAGGTVRAVVVGIDLYRNVPPLRGAVADAEDLSLSLRVVGARDVTLLTNGAASRDRVLAAISDVTARTGPGDLVVLSVAGHGSSEPERVKGSKPGGRDEVYVLAGFDTRLPGSRERIFGDEFKALIRRIEGRGADILFIADTCHAGGLTRTADPRAGRTTWREAPPYTIEEDDLAPISTNADALASEFDFERLTFVAAVDDKSKTPEIAIPGIAGRRGALSYAAARAFEGAADRNGDGRVSRRELFEYLRQTVYQFTDQRQNVFTQSVSGTDLDRSVVYAYGPAPDDAPPTPGPAAASPAGPPPPLAVAALGPARVLDAVRPALTPFRLVDAAEADLVFDPARGQAVANGDVVASGVGPEDIPFVVDRMAARERLKTLSEKAPQAIRVTPDDSLHGQGQTVGVAVSDMEGRRLVLFDITGDGTVQFLYPAPDEREDAPASPFALDLAVVPPFGTDMLVAVTSTESIERLEQFLHENDNRRTAGKIADRLGDMLPPDARIGFSVLYTAAGDRP